MTIDVPPEAMTALRELFIAVEGSCEQWEDQEVARRILIRGAMDYAKSAGKDWDEIQAVAAELRGALASASAST